MDLRGISIAIRPPSPVSAEVQKAIDESVVLEREQQMMRVDSSAQNLEDLNRNVEINFTETPDNDLNNECVCSRSRAESKHSYSNSSIEDDEYSAMLKHDSKDIADERFASDHNKVVSVTVHHECDDNSRGFPKDISGKSLNHVEKDIDMPKNNMFINSTGLVNKGEKENRVTFFDVVEEMRGVKKNEDEQNLSKTDAKLGSESKSSHFDKGPFHSSKDTISSSDIIPHIDPSIDAVDSTDSSVLLLSYTKLDSASDVKPESEHNAQNVNKLNSSTETGSPKEIQLSVDEPSPQGSKSYGATDNATDKSLNHSGNRESWARRKLRQSFSRSKEQNNNEGISNTDELDASGEQARHRWKLVLNVQKFQSAVRQPQAKTPLPESEKEKPVVTPTKISMRWVSFQMYNSVR